MFSPIHHVGIPLYTNKHCGRATVNNLLEYHLIVMYYGHELADIT